MSRGRDDRTRFFVVGVAMSEKQKSGGAKKSAKPLAEADEATQAAKPTEKAPKAKRAAEGEAETDEQAEPVAAPAAPAPVMHGGIPAGPIRPLSPPRAPAKAENF